MLLGLGLLQSGCTCAKKDRPQQEASIAPSTQTQPSPTYRKGLLLALSEFEVGPDGKAMAKPKPARMDILKHNGARWDVETIADSESNVFHKAMVYPVGSSAKPQPVITLGGNAAAVKRWTFSANRWKPETLWTASWGGKFNRMRDAEIADLFGDGTPAIAIATHDQGVVAIMQKRGDGFDVKEIDHKPNTFVHEIEIGDLNKDGVLEVYATPSEPNKLDGAIQTGEVVRYVPKTGEGRKVVARFANRHAKEILVRDVDGDGTDELYVSVEAEMQGAGDAMQIKTPVQILRFDAQTPPDKGVVVAEIQDRLCRFLTAGDVDGDGKLEMVAAAFRSGLWLLKPSADKKGPWAITQIDANSSGFEHAALLTDLDGDRKAELYVGSDDQGEVRQYRYERGAWKKAVLQTREHPDAIMTWNIMPH